MSNLKKTLSVPLKFDFSVLILLGLFLYTYGIRGLLYFLIVEVSILFHEYSHVYAAIKNNVPVQYVKTFLFGAGAFMESNSILLNKKVGLIIAFAGPFGSFILASISLLFYLLLNGTPSGILGFIFMINIMLTVFNLLPLYPSDGGRILYCLLSYIMDYKKALKMSVILSIILSIAGIVASFIFGSFWMVFMFIILILFAVADYNNSKQVLGSSI